MDNFKRRDVFHWSSIRHFVQVAWIYTKEVRIAFFGGEHGLGKVDLWHQRFGHLSIANLRKLSYNNLVQNLDLGKNSTLEFCKGCVYDKQHRDPFPTDGNSRAIQI